MPRPDGPVAVTGAAGYLGGRVATALGDDARAIVRAPVAWLPERVQDTCDLLGPSAGVRAALEGAAAVVHLAGHNEVIATQDPARATEETVAMATAVRDGARAAGVRRLVYVSTVHVYGEHLRAGAVIDEDLAPAPISAYAQARLACEEAFGADDQVDAVVLRLSNAVGAPADPSVDRWTLVANDICRQAVLDRKMVLRSSGQQWRDFIALEDACRLVIGALDPALVPAGVYNLASGHPSTVRALAEMIQDRVERSCGWRPVLEAPPADGEPEAPYTVATEALGRHGLRAEVALEEGVDEIIDHCIKHEASLRSS